MVWHVHTIGSIVPLGVDFRGGTEVQVQFANHPDIGAIRSAMEKAGIRDSKIQAYGGDLNRNEVLISLPEQRNENALDAGRKQIVDGLQANYNNPFDPSKGVKVDVVGPTVGHQLQVKALQATLYSLAGMLVYLWF